MTQHEIARVIGITYTAVQEAVALDARMRSRGLSDPYCRVTTPENQTWMRRHKHPRFRFQPLSHIGATQATPIQDSPAA
jgi:hypothetical protein